QLSINHSKAKDDVFLKIVSVSEPDGQNDIIFDSNVLIENQIFIGEDTLRLGSKNCSSMIIRNNTFIRPFEIFCTDISSLIIQNNNFLRSGSIEIYQCGNVTITNNRIEGPNTEDGFSLYIQDCTNTSLLQNRLKQKITFLMLENCPKSEIKDNDFNSGASLILNKCNGSKIIKNYLKLDCAYSENLIVSNNIIKNTRSTGSYNVGLGFFHCSKSIIRDNLIHNISYIREYSNSTTVIQGTGISVLYSDQLTLTNNDFKFLSVGIKIKNSNESIISYNNFSQILPNPDDIARYNLQNKTVGIPVMVLITPDDFYNIPNMVIAVFNNNYWEGKLLSEYVVCTEPLWDNNKSTSPGFTFVLVNFFFVCLILFYRKRRY
ncbi:MAG: right-handed parallel beta-helix repeat-containing protein, partial [Candidatus Hodarchaeales archaeon]